MEFSQWINSMIYVHCNPFHWIIDITKTLYSLRTPKRTGVSIYLAICNPFQRGLSGVKGEGKAEDFFYIKLSRLKWIDLSKAFLEKI